MEKRLKIGALTIHPSLLESVSPSAPSGSLHISSAITVEEMRQDGEVAEYGGTPEDRVITRSDFVQRARDLYADIAQSIADESAMQVRATANLKSETVKPK